MTSLKEAPASVSVVDPQEPGVEIRSPFVPDEPKRVPRLVGLALASGCAVHGFFYEPWSPIVVRARGTTEAVIRLRESLANMDSPPEVVPWSPHEDRELFGPETYDSAIRCFFEASTQVAHQTTMVKGSDSRLGQAYLLLKLVHCFLNAQGLDTPHEARFAEDFARNRRKQARRDYGPFWRRRK